MLLINVMIEQFRKPKCNVKLCTVLPRLFTKVCKQCPYNRIIVIKQDYLLGYYFITTDIKLLLYYVPFFSRGDC